MGEAKRRAEAYGAAKPYVPPRVCPVCKSVRIARADLPPTGLSHVGTVYDCCRECGAVWEAYPADWCEDVVGAQPCDNCAFRPGAPEHNDPVAWKALIATLRAGGEFRCHKGAPILGLNLNTQTPAPGAGMVSGEFDAAWVNRRGRPCAGFMRMVWALNAKGEDWLSRHHEFCGAPGYDLPLSQGAGE
jgi:hypothetical protein